MISYYLAQIVDIYVKNTMDIFRFKLTSRLSNEMHEFKVLTAFIIHNWLIDQDSICMGFNYGAGRRQIGNTLEQTAEQTGSTIVGALRLQSLTK